MSSCHVERSLTLSWPDKSFRPRSLVVDSGQEPKGRAHSRGSKDVLGDIGVSPRGQMFKSPTLPSRVSPLRMQCCLDP